MSQKVDTVVQFSGLKTGRYEYSYVLDNTFFEGYENDELRGEKSILRLFWSVTSVC